MGGSEQRAEPGEPRREIWVLTGPTASGKSSLALALAEIEEVEILSMDSMAVYRRMDIGTAKPTAEERQAVQHHLIDLVEPCESYDTNRYCQAARDALAAVRGRGRQPLFVGGTTLYLMAFFKGLMQVPAASVELRRQLQEQEEAEPGSLHRRLQVLDPEAAERIHRNDLKRLVRAHEVLELTGQPISALRQQFDRAGFQRPCRILAVSRQREELHQRVRKRTVRMLEAGLVEEVRRIQDSCGFSPQSAAGIGYAECLKHLRGEYRDTEELRNMIRRHTHRLIRRQSTWLRRIPEVSWVSADIGPRELHRRFLAGGSVGG